MFKCEWNFLWDEQKCSCVETAGWLVIKIIVSVFEAFGPLYLNRWNVFAIISHQHHEADTRASLSKSFTVTDMFNKRDSDLKRAVTGRRSFNHTAFLRCVCVCVCFWSPETKCMQQSTGSSSADWLLGFSDDPDQLVFALCRNPSRSAEADLRREAAGRWPHALRLQHPEGEPGTPPQRNEGFSVNVDSEFSLRFRASVIQRSSDELLLCFLILPLFWV